MLRHALQSTASECGLACLAMVASAHGLRLDLAELRQRFALSLKGANLQQLMRYAQALNFSPRALRLDMAELPQLRTPCILHWDMNHFVVLVRATARGITILDPAVGRRKLALAEVSRHFTGVALELAPNAEFKPAEQRRRLRLRDLTGRVLGLRGTLAGLFTLALALEAIALLVPMTTQWVVDDALVSGDRQLLTLIVAGAGVLAVADFLIRMARGWVALRLSMDMGLQWTSNVFAHLVRLPVSWFEQRHLGDISSRFQSLQTIKGVLTTSAVEAAIDGVMIVATLALMVLYSSALAGISLIALTLYAVLRAASYGAFREASQERIVLAAKESSYFLETLRAITPLKLFGREAERLGRWQNLAVDVQNRDVRTAKMNLWFNAGNTVIFGVEGALLLLVGGLAILDGKLSVGMLMAFIAYKSQFASRATALINLAVDVKMLGLHAERLADVVLEKPEPEMPVETDVSRLAPAIELRHVSFRYGEGEPWVLRDCSLAIDAGESLAVVGPSGCGKTTLLKIMLGLHAPQEGEVLVGGVPIRQLGLAQYRRLVGTVMQDDALLAGSIAENIAFFDTALDWHRVYAAAAVACVHDDIVAMPMGYQTLVGDMGSSLSGGQKQRVLLARALYKQPKVLALDEATSHLDIDNERRVNQTVQQLALTRIVIAHRPETIAHAARVVQLEGGKVVRDMRQSLPAAHAGGNPGPVLPPHNPAEQIAGVSATHSGAYA